MAKRLPLERRIYESTLVGQTDQIALITRLKKLNVSDAFLTAKTENHFGVTFESLCRRFNYFRFSGLLRGHPLHNATLRRITPWHETNTKMIRQEYFPVSARARTFTGAACIRTE